ncbi:tRNA (cytidine(34)-2'-O)-methyltransferase [Candidatus Persebacteraceae bacterium Df01]|jgi:tRNA (cytidine/uridine-2'-O-)-methyltransferase|uniref:tRNA (cytidine(34)-2'-O)-methyltransferase n=1 Tax=Candidatus Doriopsillibacter californiensis TaxID=2970740 RepID=A0ABT7QKW3_9GAMM|nr:tRNA (cytidine(34)-2'-O)-methyltransferase [Candidatus Persebacteraceae bacterium Df01]
MFHIILVNPEIPPNTGNVIRLTANIGAQLHLVKPLGFSLDNKLLRRAGLDYHEHTNMKVHGSLPAALSAAGSGQNYAATGKGETRFDTPHYHPGDIFVFGCESVGLPDDILSTQFTPTTRLFIPMQPRNRSLNLSNSVAVILMEAWRQQEFSGSIRTDNQGNNSN